MQNQIKYWIGVASKDHVKNGVKEGICQLCHGKNTPLKRMSKNDWIIYYSGKETFGKTTPYQKFTAIGKVADDEIYQFEMNPEFIPFRRKIDFIESKDADIRPLINDLEFITNKAKWGAPFRFGFLQINWHEFEIISSVMKA
jgi:predicted RNA-binding protein